jgi:hypothetical protein
MLRHLRATHLTLVLTAAVIAVTGCTTYDDRSDRPAPRPGATFGPAAELADAARHLRQTSFAVTLSVGLEQGTSTLAGRMDARRRLGTFTATTSGRSADRTVTQWRMAGPILYASTTTNGAAADPQRPWRRIRSEGASLDVAAMAQALTKAIAVQRSGPQRFTGILDGTSANIAFGLPAPAPAGGSTTGAPAATSVAFTATVDERGRLAGYRATITPIAGASRPSSVSISDYGTTVSVQPPPPGRVTGITIS